MVSGEDNLIEIASLCTKLETINFNNCSIIGSQLIKCSFTYDKFMRIFLKHLTNYVWEFKNNDDLHLSVFSELFRCFDTLIRNETLQNIKFVIYDEDIEINMYFFDKLIRFCEVKRNTKIIVKLLKKTTESKIFFNNTKKCLKKQNIQEN